MKETTSPIKALWQSCRKGVLLGAALATLIFIGITAAGNLSAQAAFAGVSVNVRLSQTGSDRLKQELSARLEEEGLKGKLLLTDARLEAFETRQDLNTNYYALQALLLLYETQEIDMMLLDQIAMENFLRQGIYLDLRELFPEDRLAGLGSAVVYGKAGSQAEAVPLVLDVTQLPFIREHAEAEGKIYLAFMENTPRLAACRLLWDVITTWEEGTE